MRGPVEDRTTPQSADRNAAVPRITLQSRPLIHPPVDPKLEATAMLKAIRESHGLGKSRFATLLGVYASNYDAIEAGRVKLSLEKAMQWSERLGYKPDMLLAAALRQQLCAFANRDYYVELHPVRKR